jgi:hypothetical protein
MTRPALIDHPAAWTVADLGGKDRIAFDLDARHVRALDDAVAATRRRGLALADVRAADVPLGPLAPLVERLRRVLLEGRGVAIVRGFPVGDRDEETIAAMYWGLGAHLGRAVSQSLMGDRLGHVLDASRGNEHARGYRSARELDPHTDSDDIVGLLCLRPAKSGGESLLTSSLAVHDALVREEPAHLPRLYRGFHYHWNGEEPPGEPPITPYEIPVFAEVAGVWSSIYLRFFIDKAGEENGVKEGEGKAALDAFDARAKREDLQLRFRLEPGEASLINNYTTLHARTAFVDHEDPARCRHLLRLWLQATPRRPLHPAYRRYYGEDGMVKQARGVERYAGDTMGAAAP